MFDEIFKKFPQMIKTLLEKSITSSSKEEYKKLLHKIKAITEEMDRLTRVSGERLTDEQIKKILEIPRSTPDMFKWKIKK